MCFTPFLSILGIIPYLIILLMPVFGSYYGKEPVLGCSLYLMGHGLISCFCSSFLIFAEPLVQLAIAAVFLSLRVSLVPYPVIWLYDKALFISEPIWQMSEALGVVHLNMALSQEAADRIDDQPDIAKGYIITVSAVSYGLTLWLLVNIVNIDSTVYIWAALMLLLVNVIVHVVAIKQDAGILSDAAVVGLISMALLYDICYHSMYKHSPIEVPESWNSYMMSHSYISMLMNIFSSGGATHAWSFFSRLVSPWFICTSLARVSCILFLTDLIKAVLHRMNSNSESSEERKPWVESTNLEEKPLSFSLWKSPFAIKIIVIFVYTQFLICHLDCPLHGDNSFLTKLQSWFPSGRWVQIALLNIYYLYRVNDEQTVGSCD